MQQDIKPKIVDDIKKNVLFSDRKNVIYSIGSIQKDRYITADANSVDYIMDVFSQFNGKQTVEEISNKFIRDYNKQIDVHKLLDIAIAGGLIINADKKSTCFNEFEKYGVKLFEMNIAKLEKLINFISNKIGKIVLSILLMEVFCSIFLLPGFSKHLAVFNLYNVMNSSILSIILSTVITSTSVIMHEFSHAIIGIKNGLVPKKITFSIYMFTPIIYINIPGIYTLKKSNRILIHGVGILTNIGILCIGIIGSYFFTGTLSEIFMLIAFNNLGLIVMNIIPFMPIDGYFILMNLLKIPNLRKLSINKIRLILDTKDNVYKIIYLVYNIISVLFVIFMVFTIITQISSNFMKGFSDNRNIINGLYRIRGYLLILLLMISSKIILWLRKDKQK